MMEADESREQSMNGSSNGNSGPTHETDVETGNPTTPKKNSSQHVKEENFSSAIVEPSSADQIKNNSPATIMASDQQASFVIDAEDEEETDVFVDEPLNTTPAQSTTKSSKHGHKSRSKAIVAAISSPFSAKSQAPKICNNQKSYWSSDEDDALGGREGEKRRKGAARPKRANEKMNTAGMPASAQSQPQAKSRPRTKRSRSKRPLRRVQDDKDGADEGECTTSDEDEGMHQRAHSPMLNSMPKTSNITNNDNQVDQKPPPVAVVRTKAKTPLHISPKAAKGSSFLSPTLNNSGASNNNLSNHAGATATGPSSASKAANALVAGSSNQQFLSLEDMEICQRLDDEYENALEEREIGYMARYTSVRQSACFSVMFMLTFLSLGTTFFMRYADWSIHDSLLFSIYTITTVGYGNKSIPKETGFQCFTILYIFVGIATLTIMVAQVYQWIALEASRAQHSRDRSELSRRGFDLSSRGRRTQQSPPGNSIVSSQASANSSVTHEDTAMFFDVEDWACFDTVVRHYEQAKHFFTYNEYGRSFSVLFPFAGLIVVGAIVVGPIEGWNIVESVYFAVVSLTTVGFGDYYPRQVPSIWFCVLWLPFSIGFMSMFLRNVATFYIRLSAQNINRIERRMRRRLAQAKERFELERAEALKRAYHGQSQGAELELRRFPSADDSVDSHNEKAHSARGPGNFPAGLGARRRGRHRNFNALPTNPEDSSTTTPPVTASKGSLFGSPEEGTAAGSRRKRILKNSLGGDHDDDRLKGQTMDTMKDIIKAVHNSIESGSSGSRFLSVRSSVMKLPLAGGGNDAPMRKPSFALRALVQERFAEIVATDIAGFQSSIEIKDNTLSVTIDSLRDTAEKWLVPRRARKAFRAVAFEALYFVGEHGLITRGADALYDLTPFEFHALFNPLLAAMGDADTMLAWLASTDVLAEVDLLKKTVVAAGSGDVETGDTDVVGTLDTARTEGNEGRRSRVT